jgi:hypothetical protein
MNFFPSGGRFAELVRIVVVASCLAVPARGSTAFNSSEPAVGVGLQIGSPTAVTIKFGGARASGVVLGIGAGFGYGKQFGASLWMHADYLFLGGHLRPGHMWTPQNRPYAESGTAFLYPCATSDFIPAFVR